MDINKHAADRLKERAGLKKSSIDKNAEKAYTHGMKREDANGRMRKYFGFLHHKYPRVNNNVRIYNDMVYIFTPKKRLITVFPLPNAHKAAYKKFKSKQKMEVHSE